MADADNTALAVEESNVPADPRELARMLAAVQAQALALSGALAKARMVEATQFVSNIEEAISTLGDDMPAFDATWTVRWDAQTKQVFVSAVVNAAGSHRAVNNAGAPVSGTPKASPGLRETQIREMRSRGLSKSAISKELGITASTVHAHCVAHGIG